MSSTVIIEMTVATVVTALVLVILFGIIGAISIFFARIVWWVFSNT